MGHFTELSATVRCCRNGQTAKFRLRRRISRLPSCEEIQGCPIRTHRNCWLAGAVAYGIYSFKNKGAMSTSVYLMKFRVIAQSMVVVALGAGVTYSMFNDYVLPKFSKTEAKKP